MLWAFPQTEDPNAMRNTLELEVEVLVVPDEHHAEAVKRIASLRTQYQTAAFEALTPPSLEEDEASTYVNSHFPYTPEEAQKREAARLHAKAMKKTTKAVNKDSKDLQKAEAALDKARKAAAASQEARTEELDTFARRWGGTGKQEASWQSEDPLPSDI